MKPQIQLGDVIQTKKPHPCGSDRWEVIRTGADIKLRCLSCGRIVMLPYEDFARRWKQTLSSPGKKGTPHVSHT